MKSRKRQPHPPKAVDAKQNPSKNGAAHTSDEQCDAFGDVSISNRQNMVGLRETLMHSREETADQRDSTLQQREQVIGTRETQLASREKSTEDAEAIGALLNNHMDRLREANEHLVITAVEAQVMAGLAQKAKDQIDHMAHHDSLTGLPNRVMLAERLTQAIALAKRHQGQIAVLFIDLDRFKAINDSLGHAVGDSLLQLVAQRLRSTIRESDTVSRHGGDEFVVLLPEIGGKKDIEAMAGTICAKVGAPYFLVEQDLHIGVTIGISVYPADGADAETLIQSADVAMYNAKDAGRNRYHFFQAQMNERAVVRQKIEGELHRALERSEFELYYQPLVDLRTGNIVCVEALIRWRHPSRGVLEPARFVSIAETCGVIMPIGAWVLDEACRQARAWQNQGLNPPVVAVNVSSLQFNVGDFAACVAEKLGKYQLSPSMLALELTETVLMDNVESTMTMLQTLKSIGVKVAIDDFGTGFSSLAYLRRFPIDKLKIDMSFIRDVTTNPDDAAIVLAVISMAHSLKLDVIAEGVETEAQLNYLRHHRCDQIQGHYFSPPLPAQQLTDMLLQNKRLA
jgi:diguanylate cyclase (GGDEF)-like protein